MLVNSAIVKHGQKQWISTKDCFQKVHETLEKHISIRSQGKWTKKELLSIVVGLAGETQSVHSIQDKIVNRPAENTIWYHLRKLTIQDLENTSVDLLVSPVSDLLPKKPCIMAIDYTDDPYYGTISPENEGYVVGGMTKKSTNSFYRYATLYLITGNIKLTLAALPFKKGMKNVDCLSTFLDVVKALNLKIKVLLLDRGFYSSEVFTFLRFESIPYIIPVVKHGKRMKQLLEGRRSHFVKYTMTTRPIEVKIAVVVKYLKGQCNRHGRVHLGYVVEGIDWQPQKIHRIYRKRFGIESSYRMRNCVRIRTTTKNPAIRFLFVLVALLMKNVWVGFCWWYFSPRKRGPRTIVRDSFQFDRFRLFIWEHVVKLFGRVRKVHVLRLPT